MIGKNQRLREWEPRPGEPNPSYVGFVLFLSLGPNRERIIEKETGKKFWEILMSGLEQMSDTAPLHLVCQEVLGVLNNMIRKDALGSMDRNTDEYTSIERFHDQLHKDKELKSRIRKMIKNLKNLQREEEL